jgi:predicted O-methyltransferase YrrM
MRGPWRKRKATIDTPSIPGESAEPQVRFEVGEFYSPMYDTRELEQIKDRLWPAVPPETPGIDWRDQEQLALCTDGFANQTFRRFPEEAADEGEFSVKNGQFPVLDAWVLEGMLRHHRPRRMIEVGCGYSTLVTARVNREELAGEMDLICIDPYPKPFLAAGNVGGIREIRPEKVEEAPLELFEQLGENDVLFIDTSHTVKTGGDVTWLFHEVLPRLRPGVLVHIHDIFLPHEYPQQWVFEGWGWNEMYLVRSFLLFNSAFEIVWATAYMFTYHRERVAAAFPDYPDQGPMIGASMWIRRRG